MKYFMMLIALSSLGCSHFATSSPDYRTPATSELNETKTVFFS